jgi:muramoyltetrapeptide carboxypeptidase
MLKRGDIVAILSGSSCLPVLFPHRIEQGVKALEALGFRPQLFPTIKKRLEGSAGTAAERAEDIHAAFANPEVGAIVTAIGGLTANEVLPLLNYDLIRKNPKIFVGSSDNTLFSYAFAAESSLVTFYGPCLMTEFAEFPAPLSYTVEYFLKAVGTNQPIGSVQPSPEWTDEFLDWMEKEDLKRPRKLTPNHDAHHWVRNGHARGKLVGGCLPSIHQLKGTPFDLDYHGKILFIETPEGDAPGTGVSLSTVSSNLMDLRLAGIFDQIAGLVVGRGYGYNAEDRQELQKIIETHTAPYDFPVLTNVNIGHASPVATIPLLVEATLEPKHGLSILESGVC